MSEHHSDTVIDQFVGLTGASATVAQQYVGTSGGSLADGMYHDDLDHRDPNAMLRLAEAALRRRRQRGHAASVKGSCDVNVVDNRSLGGTLGNSRQSQGILSCCSYLSVKQRRILLSGSVIRRNSQLTNPRQQ